jgi:hypothetical protein
MYPVTEEVIRWFHRNGSEEMGTCTAKDHEEGYADNTKVAVPEHPTAIDLDTV